MRGLQRPDTQREEASGRNGDSKDASTSPGIPTARGHQKLERNKEGSFSKAFRGSYGPTDTLIADF